MAEWCAWKYDGEVYPVSGIQAQFRELQEEIEQLNVADFDPEEKYLEVRLGKGRVKRRVYIPQVAVKTIQAWIEVYQPTNTTEPLFVRINKAKFIVRERLKENGMYAVLRARAKESGVTDISPHDFRRTYISDMFDKGVDISTIARMVGHNDMDTTASYDRRKDDPKKRAASLLDE